ncbi:MAG: haloacid dehalogenase-like hydrolase [Actinomycetales bacterium]|nr:haloacid dehalogenase-like hydrolase [Actinomycetales bacterium]
MTASTNGELDSQLRLLLWDIDGTLIGMRGRARDKHAQTFGRVLGMATPTTPRTSGKTDGQIFAELAAQEGVALDDVTLQALFDDLLATSRTELAQHPATPAPAVIEVLDELTEQGWRHGLLTGNVPQRAQVKLESAGLWDRIDQDFCFFGTAPTHRTELGALAGRTLRANFSPVVAVVIGDTPLDLEAARAGGFPGVLVATGLHDHPELQAVQPDLFITDLDSGRDDFLEFLARQ